VASFANGETRLSSSVAGASDRRPLICDTGALLDYLVATARDHRAFRTAIDHARTRYVPGLVLAEVDYFLRDERRAIAGLIRDLARGAFTYVPPTLPLLERALEIDSLYEDLGLGLVDASVVAVAEFLGVGRIATRDVRDFSAVRLRDGSRLELVVQPSDPDRKPR
jgi:predicted nucleic acid-binding protein